MMKNYDFISHISFIIKSENGELLSFIGQSITFRLSIIELYFLLSDKDPKQIKIQS